MEWRQDRRRRQRQRRQCNFVRGLFVCTRRAPAKREASKVKVVNRRRAVGLRRGEEAGRRTYEKPKRAPVVTLVAPTSHFLRLGRQKWERMRG